jgi:hypothetical protein
LSSAGDARHAIGALRATLEVNIGNLPPHYLQPRLSAIHDCHNAVNGKIDSLEYCAAVLTSINWLQFAGVVAGLPGPRERVCQIQDQALVIQARGGQAYTLACILFEQLVSAAKNLTDVLAALLSAMWSMPLRGGEITLKRVCAVARGQRSDHPIIGQFSNLTENDGSWLSVSERLRNESQHRDATSILLSPFRGNPTDPPYLDAMLFPRSTPLQRRLDNLCPWIEGETYDFLVSVCKHIQARPNL